MFLHVTEKLFIFTITIICLFILFIYCYLPYIIPSRSTSMNMMLIKEELSQSKNINIQHSTFKNNKFDLSHFNYSGICSNPFKYKQNNKRDLIFNSVYYDDVETWKKHKEEIQQAIELSHHTIPHATKILYLYGDINDEEFKKMFHQNGYQIVRSEFKMNRTYKKKKYIVSQRYIDFETYLKEHQSEYDRVVFSDLRDVYWFADGFATISPDELILMNECDDLGNYVLKCLDYGRMNKYQPNYKWVDKFYGKEIYSMMKEKKSKVLNGGFIAGSTEKMLQFLKIMNKQLNKKPEYLYEWGYDQATLNYIYHFGKLDSLNVTSNTITQRLGFDIFQHYKYDKEKKALYMKSNGCSSIIRHKLMKTHSMK